MRTDPVSDIFTFLTGSFYDEPDWVHYIYWALAIASIAIAVAAWMRVPAQARPLNLFRFALRFLLASFWWQQSLWKFPTDTGGLLYWTQQEVKNSAYAIQGQLIDKLIIPIFQPFAYAVYGFEVLVAVLLFLGLYVRPISALGTLLIVNLYFGLYRNATEWPWSYAFLIVLMVVMVVENYGLSLGLDAFLAARSPEARRKRAAAMAM